MRKLLNYILFRTVLIIITLHTIIPHPHSEELTREKHFELHKESTSLLGIIRLVFHENDDDTLDHLIFAEYEGVNKIDFKQTYYPKSALFNSSSLLVENTAIEKITPWKTNNFEKLLFVTLNGLRGPPLLA